MKQIYADSIAEATSHYANNRDVLHDLAHSERVAENAKQIAAEIGYKDLDFLELCSMWHDVARTVGREPHEEEGAIMARDDLLSRGASQTLANLAYEAIRFHKSTASPVTIEGKIIRDADKLDIFSVVRWQKCQDAGWAREYAEDLDKTLENLDRYPGVFTYDYAKQLYKDRLPEFLKLSEQLINT